MNTIILLALPDEAPLLRLHPLVYYTGVGKVNAAIRTAQLIERYKPQRIINFGTAGGITDFGITRMHKICTERYHMSSIGMS